MSEEIFIENIEMERLIELKTDLCQAMKESRDVNFPDEKGFDSETRFNSLCEYMRNGSAKVAVAFLGSQFAGYAWFFKLTENRIHLNEIDVLQKFHGMHIGTELINYIENYAKAINCNKIELYCMESNSEARKFYNSNNFDTEKRLLVKQF